MFVSPNELGWQLGQFARITRSVRLFGVVKDDAERIAPSGANAAHTVAEIYAVKAARPLDRTVVMNSKSDTISLA